MAFLSSSTFSLRCIFRASLLLFLLASPVAIWAKDKDKDKSIGKDKDKSATEFFESALVPNLKLEVAPAEVEKLKAEPKTYVKAKLAEEGGGVFPEVAVKLKGAAGSFQEIDQRPAFTLNMDRFKDDVNFHGIEKFHLNNSVQDETYFHEVLAAYICKAAGLPAPRVSHARVWLNGRDLGLYVLKEGVNKTFLKQHFSSSKGNLYDGGFCADIDSDLERDDGKGEDTHEDLKALTAACRTESLPERWPLLEKLVNVDAFLTFAAVEYMIGHWDGYCNNQNNYRLYFDPSDGGRAHFLPHGMDQVFTEPGASILSPPKGLVAGAIFQNPIWRKAYREKIKKLLPLFVPAKPLIKEAKDVWEKLKPTLAKMGSDTMKTHAEKVKELVERLQARADSLKEQSNEPEPEPLDFDDQGFANLADQQWTSHAEEGGPEVEDVQEENKPRLLRLKCNEADKTIASWRASVLLAPGKYAFQGKAKSQEVKSEADEKGLGGGLRISGQNRTNKLVDTNEWTELSFEFTVDAQQHVELVAELRAKSGEIWFDASALKLKRLGK